MSQYAFTAATARANIWIAKVNGPGLPERAEFEAAAASLESLVRRFPNEGPHFRNLAHLQRAGFEVFGDPQLAEAAKATAVAGLAIDPRDPELLKQAGR